MLAVKIKLCFDYWKRLSDEEKEGSTAKHLRAACECAAKLLEQKDHHEHEARRLRMKYES